MNPFPVPQHGSVAAVIGFPAAHSKSPLIHNSWLQQHGIAGRYEAITVPPGALEAFVNALPVTALRGCNVTVPHKENVLGLMHRLDPLAAMVGAVNTIIVDKDGRLEGRNTDVYGFTANLESAGNAWKKRKPALIIGAGGAARAVVAALYEAGCPHIRIVNRTTDRARDLIADMKSRTPKLPLELIAWQDREDVLGDVHLVVNTTTQGMADQPPLELSLKDLNDDALVTDLVYTPLITPLLAEARRRNHVIVDGLGMLLHQAVPAFAAWFGVRPAVTLELRQLIEKSLQENAI